MLPPRTRPRCPRAPCCPPKQIRGGPGIHVGPLKNIQGGPRLQVAPLKHVQGVPGLHVAPQNTSKVSQGSMLPPKTCPRCPRAPRCSPKTCPRAHTEPPRGAAQLQLRTGSGKAKVRQEKQWGHERPFSVPQGQGMRPPPLPAPSGPRAGKSKE